MSKKIVIASIISLSLLLFAGAVALSNNGDNDPIATSQVQEVEKYEFAHLGSRCATGVTKYKRNAKAVSGQAEKDYAALQADIAETEALAYANASYNTTNLNSAREDYLAIYNAGGMTSEEYRDKVAQLDQAQTAVGDPSSSILSELNRLRSEAAQYYEEKKDDVVEMKKAATKLQSCVHSAKAERHFTPSDVAEFEALISDSSKP